MRTTIDIPDHLDPILRSVARDRGTSLSQVVAELLERVLGGEPATLKAEIKLSAAGFPFITTPGRIFTSEDVRALEDEI